VELQTLDWMIIIGCVVAAAGGYRIGFVARAASWVGVILGLVAALALLPPILRDAAEMSDGARLGIVVITTLSGALLGQMLGIVVGTKLSGTLPEGNWRKADQGIGIAGGVVGVLAAMWLILPTAADVPGWSAQQVRSSAVAQGLDQWAPDPPDAVQTLRRLVGSESFQPVFEGIQPAPDTGPPPGSVALSQEVITQVSASTVRVEGVACRTTQNGSGFAVGPGLFVTNAHVVAGERETTIIDNSGTAHDADVIVFDADRDLALLQSSTHQPPGLPIADASNGDVGAVFGHPGGSPDLVISPASVEDQVIAVGRDLYDEDETRRSVLILSANLRQGDSGGALVNSAGEVVGVAFAIAPDNPDTAYALDTEELRNLLQQQRLPEANTGPCLRN
jgi:S1-C subfamily serine protease